MAGSDILRRIAALKLSPEAMSEVLSIIADVEASHEAVQAEIATRRKKDADRKRDSRAKGHSTDNPRTIHATAQDTVSPKKETSPTPPKEKTTPSSSEAVASSLTPRGELEIVLDADRAQAVLDHRQRLRKPLTAHAARLLAGKFRRADDPNAAADAMIANGWQGFEPEWLNDRKQTQRAASPPKPRTIGDIFRDDAKRMGLIDDEPTYEAPGRMDTSNGSGQGGSPGVARRLAISGDLLGRIGQG